MTQQEGEPTVKRKRGRPSIANQNTGSSTTSNRNSGTPATTSLVGSPRPSGINASQPSIGGGAPTDGTIVPSSEDTSNSENILSQDILDQFRDIGKTTQADSDDALFGSPKALNESLESSDNSATTNKLPSHRARAANPLVKMADDFDLGHGMDSAISTKARLLAQGGAGASHGEGSTADALNTTSSKRGPGRPAQGLQAKNRSSLLVFEKGSLKSVKGRFTHEANVGDASSSHNGSGHTDLENADGVGDDTMEVDGFLNVDSSPEKVPTGQELLQMAGINASDAEALPDFEDDAPLELSPLPDEASVQSRFAQSTNIRISPD